MRLVLLALSGLAMAVVPTPTRQVPTPAAMTATWVATRDTPASIAVAPSAVFGERFGLVVTDRELTLSRLLRGASFVVRFPLDGTEVRATVPGRQCMGDGVTVGAMARTPEGLTYTLVSNAAAGAAAPTTSNLKYQIRLETPDTLVVESTIRDSAQAAPRPVGTVYRRSTDAMPPPVKGPDVTLAPATIADVAWIAGEWEGQLGTSALEERWTPAAGGAMLAISRTTRAGTMSAFEFLCVAQRNGSLVYTAMPNAGPATDFALTAIDATSATFENPGHDFPKKIRYAKRADGGLDATISGAATSKPTTFSFKRRGGS